MSYKIAYAGCWYNGKTLIWGYITEDSTVIRYSSNYVYLFWGTRDSGLYFKEALINGRLNNSLRNKKRKYKTPLNDETKNEILEQFNQHRTYLKLKHLA